MGGLSSLARVVGPYLVRVYGSLAVLLLEGTDRIQIIGP
jgi:hypothetical protein